MKVILIGPNNILPEEVTKSLASSHEVSREFPTEKSEEPTCLVYLAAWMGDRIGPDLAHASQIIQSSIEHGIKRVFLVTSATVYAPRFANPGFLTEDRPTIVGANPLADQWHQLEVLVTDTVGKDVALTVLRTCPVLTSDGKDYFSRLMRKTMTLSLAGYDPSLQFITPKALGDTIKVALEKSKGGIYNVAPSQVIPFRKALKIAKVSKLPAPLSLHYLIRTLFKSLGVAPFAQVDQIRYHWCISPEKMARDWDYRLNCTSAEAVEKATGNTADSEDYDKYGQEKDYIDFKNRTIFRWAHDLYWRIHVQGLENIPEQGRAIILGVHRGFMPFDGVMALSKVSRECKRYPRFLIHPCLIKPPFLTYFMHRIGGVVATMENGEELLDNDDLLGVFPEGINGAFRFYKNAYELGRFGRGEHVKMALRKQAPIIPFVTVGSVEIFPILGRMNIFWLKQYTGWPFIPIAPPFPLAPIPLPSKWHTVFLKPINLHEKYPPEVADDPKIVAQINDEIRQYMQKELDELRSKRKHIFFGSIFKDKS